MNELVNEYRREVNWSIEDKCFVGRCPDLFLGGCHGEDAQEVDKQLREIIVNVLEDYTSAGKELPEASKRKSRLNSAVKARRQSGLNQKNFARIIGIGTNTLRNWEQGRIRPKGTAATLLKILEKYPEILAAIADGSEELD